MVTLPDDFDDAFARLAAGGFDAVYTVPGPASNSGRGVGKTDFSTHVTRVRIAISSAPSSMSTRYCEVASKDTFWSSSRLAERQFGLTVPQSLLARDDELIVAHHAANAQDSL
jgi:hypothetical protein